MGKTYAKRAALAGFILMMWIALFDNRQASPFHNAPFEMRLIGGVLSATVFAIITGAIGGVIGLMVRSKGEKP